MPGYAMYKGSENSVNVGVGSRSSKKGLYLTLPIIIVVVTIFCATVVGVALIVHFTAPRCDKQQPATTTITTTTSAPQPSTAPPLVKDVRLPANIKPVHYTVILAPYFYGTNASQFYFTGSVHIQVNVYNSTNNIKLHADKITFNDSALTVFDETTKRNLTVTQRSYDSVRQWFSIDLNENLPIQVNGSVYIRISKFRAPLAPDLRGLYLSSYTEEGKLKYLATSQLQPTDARKTFPCFDEPAFKATFDLSLVRREDHVALSNMPTKLINNVNGSDWFDSDSAVTAVMKEDFERTPKMSTYILAFIVAQFGSIRDNDSQGRVYRNWARPEFVNQTDYSLMAAQNITQFFESYFNVPYPLNKTDQAAVPDFNAGAMENWGLIIYRESRLIFDPRMDTTSIHQAIGSVVSHELAHMWFGNLVTPDWWDDIWLNEGFASFVQNIGVDNLHKDWEMDAQFVPTQQRAAFDVDSKGASHPIYVEVYNPVQINEIFDTITYRKGATVLRMLHSFIGDDIFKKGVGKYLESNKYGNTFHTALYNSLTKQYNETNGRFLDVGEVMHRWINQMGYPVLNCSLEGASSLRLTQNHFLSDPSQVPKYPSAYNYTWIVPITMATSSNISSLSGPEVSHLVNWMREKSQTFGINGTNQWYLLNLRSSGFYRVNYNTENWKALINQLKANHSVFTPQDRARLLDDGFSLANAGYLPYSIPMEMIKYLKDETHYVPWLSALSKLAYVHSMLHRQSSEYGPFSAYMRSLLEPAFRQVGLKANASDSHLTRLKREQIVASACLFGVRDCEKSAKVEFENYVNSNYSYSIEPDVRRRVLCEGVVTSFVVVWDALFAQTKRVSHPGAQLDIIRSLACTSEPWILNRYLDYALDGDKIRRQDASSVFSAVAANPNGLQIVWDYLQRKWDEIQGKFPASFTVSYFINNLADFNTPQKLAEMERFKREQGTKLGAATRAMDLAIENVRINIKWMETNLPELKKWLSQNPTS